MEDSVSTTELDKALSELDGMYNDLSATLKRQKKADAESAANAAVNTSSSSTNPGYDEYDYDIPRPAGGRDNLATSIGYNSPEKNSITFRGEIYATSMKVRRPTSPSLSVNSDSSGCGTLPSHSIVHPNEIAFPAPPSFDPPPPASMKPIFIPAHDSDYDEVASSDEETPSPTSTEGPPTSFKNYAYTDVVLQKNKIPNDGIYDDVPDYDEVGDSEESTLRSSRDLHENNNMASAFQETRGMLPLPENVLRDSYATPVVIEMRQIQVEVHQQQSADVAEHTFTNLTLEMQNNNEKNDVSHVPIGTFPVSDSLYSLAKLKEGDEEGGQNITTMQSNGHTSGTSTMRSQKENGKDKRKKDCSCAATLPIMSAVIVIVIAIFIVVTVAYVYLGIKNDEVIAERLRSMGNPAP